MRKKFSIQLGFGIVASMLWTGAVVGQNWSGYYVGGSLGGIWSQFNGHVTDDAFVRFNGEAVPAFPQPYQANTSSFIGGGQLGYTWQQNNVVLGTELSIVGMNLNNSHTLTISEIEPTIDIFQPGDSFSSRINWEAAWVARLGMGIQNWLLYTVGGVAVTQAKVSTNILAAVVDGDLFPASSASNTNTLIGGTVGAGTEYALSQNLRFGLEYRFTGYGRQSYTVGNAAVSTNGIDFIYTPLTANMKLNTNQVLLRLNYAFHT